MENAVDAMKMAGAAMLFILAFSITMFMFGKCRETADIVMDHLSVNYFLKGVNGNKDNITRKVGLETVIPTIYRYSNQDTDLRVIIKKSDGTVLQVFDQTIESDIASEANKDTEYYKHIDKLYGEGCLGSNSYPYMFGAPWANDRAKLLERINCYITGGDANLLRNTALCVNGTQTKYNSTGNYLLHIAGGSSNKMFYEIYTEYRTSGTILIDDYGEEIITKQPNGTKKIIIYQLIN